MSLLSLSKSLNNILAGFHTASTMKNLKTSKQFKNFETQISERPASYSLKLIKKIAYLCNYQYKNEKKINLDIADQLLQNWIKQAKNSDISIPESIYKLQIITYINKSINYEEPDPTKAMLSIIKAIKLSEQQKYKSLQGKLLKFIAKLRECDLCISKNRYELGISCAQQILKSVIVKLKKPRITKNTRYMKSLSKVAINAFYKIGICEEARGLKKAAEKAYENAYIIGRKYIKQNKIFTDLNQELIHQRKQHKKATQNLKEHQIYHNTERLTSRLKIPTDNNSLQERFFANSDFDSKKINEKNPKKIPGRYYSEDKLEKLSQILQEKKDPIIMNSDHYFYKHIRDALKIDENITDKVGNVLEKAKNHIQEVNIIKEELKSRRKPIKSIGYAHRDDYVYRKINRIEQKFENKLKIQEIKFRSKLKSKVYRKLLKSINIPTRLNNRIVPPQTIFFKEPIIRRLTTTLSLVEPEKEKVFITHKNIDTLNQEIETQLEELFQEINATPSVRASPIHNDSYLSPLAKSTLKIRSVKSSPRQQILRNAILNLSKSNK